MRISVVKFYEGLYLKLRLRLLYSYFRFCKTNDRHTEIYFPFSHWPRHLSSASWFSSINQVSFWPDHPQCSRMPVKFAVPVTVDHPRSDLSLILEVYTLIWFWSGSDLGVFKILWSFAWNSHQFWGVLVQNLGDIKQLIKSGLQEQ